MNRASIACGSLLPALGGALLIALFTGCSSVAGRNDPALREFAAGRFDRAAQSLDRSYGPDVEGKDALLFLLDRGVILHTAGEYRESNKYFQEAARRAEEMDVIVLAEEAGAIVTNENLRDYRPEDYERILIHTYMAMNYALLGELEDALVECRRVQTESFAISDRRGAEFQWNAFSLYLSGLLYEAMGKENDAFIDYRKVYTLAPGFPLIKADVLRTAFLVGYPPLYDEWRTTLEGDATLLPRDSGWVVLFFQCGQSPVKVPHKDVPVVPAPMRRSRATDHGTIRIDGGVAARTHSLYDIEWTAIAGIEGRTAGLVAKRLAVMAAKEVGVRFATRPIKDKYGHDVGTAIAWILRGILYALEQPDLRSWKTLPADLQIARFPLKAGRYNLAVRFSGAPGASVDAEIRNVEVKPGGWTFLNVRTVW